MRVLITGGSGQVGTHLVAEATARGWDVLAPGRDELDLQALPDRVELSLKGIDGVLNAAAYTAVDQAESEEAEALHLNTVVPGLFADLCQKADLPLVHYSTDYVFDGSSDEPYTEQSITAPLGVYGGTKLVGEQAVLGAGGSAAILRLSWVFSAHGKNFVRTMLRLGRERGAVSVVDDQWGRPTPARAAAIAGLDTLAVLKDAPTKAGLYHFCGDETVTWAGFARAIFEAADMDIPVTPITTAEFPTPAARPRFSVMDTTKIHQTFGIEAADWRAELAQVIADLSAHEEKTS